MISLRVTTTTNLSRIICIGMDKLVVHRQERFAHGGNGSKLGRSGKHIGVSWSRTHDLWTPLNQHHRSDSRGTNPGNYLHRDLWVCTERTASASSSSSSSSSSSPFLLSPLRVHVKAHDLSLFVEPCVSKGTLSSRTVFFSPRSLTSFISDALVHPARNHFSHRNYTWPRNLSIIQSRGWSRARVRSVGRRRRRERTNAFELHF